MKVVFKAHAEARKNDQFQLLIITKGVKMSVSSSSSSISSAPTSPLASPLLRVASATEIRPEVVAISLDDQISALSEKYKELAKRYKESANSRKNLPPDPDANLPCLVEMFELAGRIRDLKNQKSEQEQEQEQKQLSDILIGKGISSPKEKAASAPRENAAGNLYPLFAQEIKKYLGMLAQFKQSQTDLGTTQTALSQSQEINSKQLEEIKKLHAELDRIKREKEAEPVKAAKDAKIKRNYC